MTSRVASAFPGLCLVALAACSTPTATPPPPTVAEASGFSEKGGARASEITVTATVEKVDVEERLVTLKAPDGALETIRVGDQVRNLAQMKRGDEVIATYYQSVAFEVVKPGEKKLGATQQEGLGRAELGDKPGAVAARVVTIVADVGKLDRKSQQAVLSGPEGKAMTVNIEDPGVFDRVKVGDRVEITLTEAVAIDVQPAPKKK
jgi:Cu/Ag efflux protein CusF